MSIVKMLNHGVRQRWLFIKYLRVLGKNTPETIYSFWTVFIPTVVITLGLSMVVKIVMEKTVLKKN